LPARFGETKSSIAVINNADAGRYLPIGVESDQFAAATFDDVAVCPENRHRFARRRAGTSDTSRRSGIEPVMN
jgi:hypothetical protein